MATIHTKNKARINKHPGAQTKETQHYARVRAWAFTRICDKLKNVIQKERRGLKNRKSQRAEKK